MAGYSARQSSFTTGDTITAAHSNNEFNQILAAFHVSTGHTHDGSTAGDGGPLSTLFSNTISMGTGADTDVAVTFNANSNDGVITWMEDEDYFQFSDDILLSTTEKVQFRDTAIYINSSTDGQLDLVADTEIQIAATTVDINGNVDISGSLTLGGTTITSTGAELNILDGVTATASELNILDGVTATASELNILDGVTATASELNILDGVTSTASELNILDGVTSTATELNLLDGSTAGTVVASKAVVVDSNKDLTGMRNLTIAGDLTISGDDLFMGTNTAGHILVADGTNFNPTAVGDLSEISSVANDDVLLAVDTSGGGLKKITRSTLVSGLATSSGISNVVEDTTPQLGGDLDVNGNALVSTSDGNIALTPNGSGVVRIDGNVDIQTGEIVLKNGGSVSNIKFYCESSNAHYTQLQSSAHSDYAGNVTLTLPAATDTLVGKATTDTLTNKTLTSAVLNTGVSGTAVLDEDNMASNSATQLATQQSIKAYVDAQITAEDLDVTSDSGTIAIDLDSETLTIAGGTGIDSSATSNTVTLAIDSTVATLSGTQTLTNKTIDASQLSGTVANARLDADLQALAGLTSAADKGIQFTGSGTAGTYDLTTAGKALLDDANAAAQRTTLGLGTVATLDAGTSANNAVQLDGSAKLPAVDGSALTNMPSGGTVSLVADGSITAGKPVILTAAGKAKQVAQTGNTVTEGIGTANQFNGTNGINYPSSSLAQVADDKVAVTYRDAANSNYGVVHIATVDDSGRTISFGTKVVINSVTSNGTGVAFDTSRSVLGATVQTESDPKLIIANYTISGTSLTKQGSSLSLITTDEVKAHTTFFDPDNNHIMVFLVYVNGSDRTFRAVAVTGNASGTPTSSYLVNTNVDSTFFNTGNPFLATYDTNVNAFFITVNKSEPSTFRGIVVTNNGSALTATERSKTKPTNYKNEPTICFDSNNNKVVMAYNTTGNYNEIVNITMTTNDFTLGTPTSTTSIGTGSSDSVSKGFLSFDPTAQRIVLLRGGGGAATSRWAVFSNDGTDFTQQTTGVWDSSTNNFAQRGGILQTAMTTNMDSNPIPIIMNNGNTGYGYAAVYTVGQSPVTNLTSTNFLGLAAESISDTATGKITVQGGINENQTSLSIGTNYFATDAGLVATSGTIFIGRAIATTKVQIEPEKEEFAVGTSANNLLQLDSNAKIPAVDGSQLTNLPAPSDARIFCGKVNLLNYGANSFTISLPSGYTASGVRAYEIYFYGVSATGEADHNFRFKPYNGGSSVLSGNNWDGIVHQVYGLGGSNTNTAQDMDVWSTYLSPISWGSENVLSHSEPVQTDTGNGYSPRMNGKITYENNVENAGYVYQSYGLYSSGGGNETFMMETGITGAQNTNTTTNYADAFYFYLGTGNFASGVVSVYAVL